MTPFAKIAGVGREVIAPGPFCPLARQRHGDHLAFLSDLSRPSRPFALAASESVAAQSPGLAGKVPVRGHQAHIKRYFMALASVSDWFFLTTRCCGQKLFTTISPTTACGGLP